jgi:hypothetical protein
MSGIEFAVVFAVSLAWPLTGADEQITPAKYRPSILILRGAV